VTAGAAGASEMGTDEAAMATPLRSQNGAPQGGAPSFLARARPEKVTARTARMSCLKSIVVVVFRLIQDS
jgi:hypothetical protein